MVIKKIYVNSWYMAIMSAMTLTWVITLFLQNMWYNKKAARIANTSYVRECVRWPGHTKISNYPVEYGSSN